MGLPKNFQTKNNLYKRLDALNNINFYKVNFEVIEKDGDEPFIMSKEVNALNDEQLEKKFVKLMEQQNFHHFKIIDYKAYSLSERIKKLGLEPLLN